MTLIGRPGRTALMPRSIAWWVRSLSSRTSSRGDAAGDAHPRDRVRVLDHRVVEIRAGAGPGADVVRTGDAGRYGAPGRDRAPLQCGRTGGHASIVQVGGDQDVPSSTSLARSRPATSTSVDFWTGLPMNRFLRPESSASSDIV